MRKISLTFLSAKQQLPEAQAPTKSCATHPGGEKHKSKILLEQERGPTPPSFSLQAAAIISHVKTL